MVERLRHASAYRRGRTFVVISTVEAQVWFKKPPCFVVRDSAGDDNLGKAVTAAIDAVWLSAPRASEEQTAAWESEILAAVGVKLLLG